MNDDEILRKNIGSKIKAARVNKGFTQYVLAEKIDMDEKQLSRLEAGKHFPTLKTLISISKELGLNLGDFDDINAIKDISYYKLVDILRVSTPKELKKYLTIIKTIRE